MPPNGEYKDFKDALRDWSNRPPPRQAPPPPPPAPVVPHHIYQPSPPERVLGGNIIREPVDRVARRVVAPAPWYFQPPDVKPKPEPRAKPKMSNKATGTETTFEQIPQNYIPGAEAPGALRTKVIGGEEYLNMDDLAVRIIQEINKYPQKLTPLARAALDARTVLDESLANIGLSMDGFKDSVKRWLEDVRTARMNYVSEANSMLGPLRDIRQFFLNSTYEKEITRLREFVDLCERLQKLKESGFLDSVTDTMLKLAVPQPVEPPKPARANARPAGVKPLY